MPGSHKPHKHILQHFAYTIVNDAKKQKATCNLCDEYKLMAHNPIHEAKYLEECKCNSSEARGQQEGLQYGRGSSGMVESSVAQMEGFGMIWDGL